MKLAILHYIGFQPGFKNRPGTQLYNIVDGTPGILLQGTVTLAQCDVNEIEVSPADANTYDAIRFERADAKAIMKT